MEEYSNLNHYFDKIYCFCKPSNYSNWNVYKNIYLFYNIDVKLIPAEDLDSRVANNVFNSLSSRNLLAKDIDLKFIADSLSHTTFINHAIDNKYNKILILKENVIPFKEYKQILSNLKIEKEWDFLIFKNNNHIIGYGITDIFYNDLLKLIKEFKLNFDEIIYSFTNKYKVLNIDNNLFFNFNKDYLNNNFISLDSLLFNKNIFFILYPFNQINFLEKDDFSFYSIYNQYDFFEWKFNFEEFIATLYNFLFTDKKIFIIGNSFCLKINEILSFFNNLKIFIIKENIENIKEIKEYKFYPELITKDDNFIENYFNFYYDYIDSISYKVQNIEFIEINNFKIKELL
jgi:hypothetical protein